jgi:hypothetical protein
MACIFHLRKNENIPILEKPKEGFGFFRKPRNRGTLRVELPGDTTGSIKIFNALSKRRHLQLNLKSLQHATPCAIHLQRICYKLVTIFEAFKTVGP